MRRDDPGPYSLDALAAASVPALFTTDAETLKARYVAWFEAASGRTLYPVQVEMLLIEALSYAMSLLGHEGQMAIEEGLVSRGSTIGLEALGPNRATPRLPASKARATLRFSSEGASLLSVLIPRGTRVSAGSEATTFLTLADAVLPIGASHVDVIAEAVQAGAAANDLQIGQITTVLDPVGGLSASNVAVSSGGADIEDVELYRLRLANFLERTSAGSRAWYREHAMGVSSAIIDCAVVRPQPCYIEIYPLTAAGAAGVDLRAQVLARFTQPDMLDDRYGDSITVPPSVAVVANPTLTVRYRGVDGAALKPLVIAAGNDPLADWRSRLGADVAPSEIETKVKALAGVIDAGVGGLPYQKLAENAFLNAAPFIDANVTMVPV